MPQKTCSRCSSIKELTTQHFEQFKNGNFKATCIDCKQPLKPPKRKALAELDSNSLLAPSLRASTNSIAPALTNSLDVFAFPPRPRAAHARALRAKSRHPYAHPSPEAIDPTLSPLVQLQPTAPPLQQPALPRIQELEREADEVEANAPVSRKQWGKVLEFRNELNDVKMELCNRCGERWFEMKLNSVGVCSTCISRDRSIQTELQAADAADVAADREYEELLSSWDGSTGLPSPPSRAPRPPYLMSAENNMSTGVVPPELCDLSTLEEMLLAPCHLNLSIWRVRGHQYHYSGHTIAFFQDSADFFTKLPLLPEHINLLVMKPATADTDARHHRQFRQDMRARAPVLLRALRWLIKHNPVFKDVQIDYNAINSLPADGDVSKCITTIEEPAMTEEERQNASQRSAGRNCDELHARGLDDGDDMAPSSSMVPNSQVTATEMELITDALKARRKNIMTLSAPHIRSTPLDELGRSHCLFAMCFPTLFPYGIGDVNQARPREVKLREWSTHLLKHSSLRFGAHPHFRYLCYNMELRERSKTTAAFYIKRRPELKAYTTEELEEALKGGDSLLLSIARAAAPIPGTRPFWGRERGQLLAQLRNAPDFGACFLTWSCADHQWDDLHQHMPRYAEWKAGNEHQRAEIARTNIQNYPHIIAAWLDIRFKKFLNIVATEVFGVSDFWYRYEWQARGTGHIHCIIWLKEGPKMNPKTVEERANFVSWWNDRISAVNPNPSRPPDARHPSSLPFLEIANTYDQLTALLNRFQSHGICAAGKCLLVRKGAEDGAPAVCRYHFPKKRREEALLTYEIDKKSLRLASVRNDERLNDYNAVTTLAWLANTDCQPLATSKAAVEYASKYVSKAEKKSASLIEVQASVLPYISSAQPVKSFAGKFINKLIGERDISAQEISHYLLRLPYARSSRQTVVFDCRPEGAQEERYELDNTGAELKKGISVLQKYKERIQRAGEGMREVTLLDFLRHYNTNSRKLSRRKSTTRAQVVQYFPYYPADAQLDSYDNYCRVKMMLHHPFLQVDELLIVEGTICETFSEAYDWCRELHDHTEDDFYDPLSSLEDGNDQVLEEAFDEDDYEALEAPALPDLPLADHEVYAAINPMRDDGCRVVDEDKLGARPLDMEYDWSQHVGKFDFPNDYWERVKGDNPAHHELPELNSVDLLNAEQSKLYTAVVQHYAKLLANEQPTPLRLNVDGEAGTGKTYVLLQISAKLDNMARATLESMAGAANRPSPVMRCAPTGIASHNIQGMTLHSLFKIPIRPALGTLLSPLSSANRLWLQRVFRDLHYLIIDEKSMISITMLALIDYRLREVFPARCDQFFGGISVLVCGDFFQLPPIAAPVMYANPPTFKSAEAASGQAAYRALDTTLRLTQMMRQDGHDEESRLFRVALAELRVHELSRQSYDLLASRVQNALPPSEVSEFNDALRLYFRREDVKKFNHRRMRDSGNPVLLVKAEHTGVGARSATEDDAEGLGAELCLSLGGRVMLTSNLWTENGLCNGSMGTVQDIIWSEGADPKLYLPRAVLVKMDSYEGPTFLDTGCIPIEPVTRKFKHKNADCTRKSFPIVPAYAITVHKSQGLTLKKVVLSFEHPDHAAGLSYVAVSRVKKLSDILIEQPFDMTRFQMKKSTNMQWRELDWAMRAFHML